MLPLHPFCQGEFAIESFLKSTNRAYNLVSLYVRKLKLNSNNANGLGDVLTDITFNLHSNSQFYRREDQTHISDKFLLSVVLLQAMATLEIPHLACSLEAIMMGPIKSHPNVLQQHYY